MSESSRSALFLFAAIAFFTGCPTSVSTDGGIDAGGGLDGGIDAGIGCVSTGSVCAPGVPCCSASDVCDPLAGLCIPDAGSGGTTGGTSSGGTTGSTSGLPNDGAQWLEERVTSDVVALGAVVAPSPGLQLAAGNGPGVAQILVRSSDAGWTVVAGVPAASALLGLWADPRGDVFAVGLSDAGTALFVAGTLDGGLASVNLDGGPAVQTLLSVVGLGPGEALAVGDPVPPAPPVALHLLPDGGLTYESFPPELTRAYRLAEGGGLVFALADSTDPTLPPWVLERSDGGWSLLPEIFSATNLVDLTVGPAGDVVLVGDDGNGNGLAYVLADGGFVPLATLPAVPALTAVSEPSPGEIFLAAAPSGAAAELFHLDGGIATGLWWLETLPADAARVDSLAGDGAGSLYAVGLRACSGCSGFPLAARRLP